MYILRKMGRTGQNAHFDSSPYNSIKEELIKIYKCINVKVKVKVAQSYPTLCDPMDYTVHGILQARILGWVAFPFSMGSSQPWDRTQASLITGGFFTS